MSEQETQRLTLRVVKAHIVMPSSINDIGRGIVVFEVSDSEGKSMGRTFYQSPFQGDDKERRRDVEGFVAMMQELQNLPPAKLGQAQ